jgi:hypothetical protein
VCGANNSGVVLSNDMQGDGAWATSMTYAEPCKCVGKNECPWCGSELTGELDDDETSTLRCTASEDECGWTWQRALESAQEPPDLEWYEHE